MPASSQLLDALKAALSPIVERERRFRKEAIITLGWLGILAGAGMGLWLGYFHATPGFAQDVFGGAVCVLALAWLIDKIWPIRLRALVHKIEARNPHLNNLLVTALEQEPDEKSGQYHFLQRRLILQALEDPRRRAWKLPTSERQHTTVFFLQWAALISILILIGFAGAFESRIGAHDFTGTETKASADVEVTPGDIDLERGSSLIITAKFLADPPSKAEAQLQPSTGEPQQIELQQSLKDPLFGGALPEVNSDLTYRIAYDGKQTRDFHIHVFEFPRLERADAHLKFPEYTKLPEKEIADTKHVTAVEGTHVDLKLQLNKPVKSAALVAKDGTRLPLDVTPGQPIAELRGHVPAKSQTYELQLEDADGRASKSPATFAMDVLANRKPEIKIVTPKGDQRVSPLQEVAFQTEVWDDFGLPKYGITYTVAGSETKEVELGKDTAADQRLKGQHLLKMEDLGVAPDQLISWFAWAEDVGPDGKARRTATDLYFAEVRPFEEIYRQGEAGGGGGGEQQGGGAGAAAQKLAEIQKQVISATWNLKRAEEGRNEPKISESYQKDEPVIRDSQKHAQEMATAMREKLENPKSKAMVEGALSEMQKAVGHLETAVTTVQPLPDALNAEEGAYNALLKLAAHEFKVSKSQQGKGQGQQAGRKEQLDQLDLKDEKERYETRKEAEAKENNKAKEEQKEDLAILNRLKELAQRQHDINERMKELQTALEEAKTEAQKEEIRKQLKRLQEDEQQLLAETDELQQKMQGQTDQSKFADERKQLEQTRNEAQKASEAMREQKPTEAVAAGTRTERDLQQLREDFRKKSSAQFNEQVRQLRTEARDLATQQKEAAQELEKQIAGAKTAERPTLDGTNPREQLAEQFEKQQERLKGLQGEMKEVSEQAEAAEPLLSKELYDALRKTAQANTEETLNKTGFLAKRGYVTQAKQLGDKAGQEIEELKNGVERAAESVLGNEEESLRQARAELDALAQQLNKEIANAAPQLAQNDKGQKPGNANLPIGEAQLRDGQPNGERSGPNLGDKPGEEKSGEANGKTAKAQGEKKDGAGKENGDGQPGEGTDPKAQRLAKEGKGEAQKPGEQGEGKEGKPGDKPGEGQGEQTAKAGEKGQGQGKPGEQPGQGKGQQTAKAGEKGEGKGQGQGDKPGDQPGEGQQTANAGEKGQGQGKPGEQSNEGKGQQTAKAGEKGEGKGQGEGQGKPDGQPGNSQGQGGAQSTASTASNQPGANLRQLASEAGRAGAANNGGGGGGGFNGGGYNWQDGPIRGDGFVQWAERLRNVEEMIDNPDTRNEVARIREIARAARAEYKRQGADPKWDIVQSQISKPLSEVRDRVAEELARHQSKESLVPIDRDPVPPKFAEQVQRYYEVLGSGAAVPTPKKAE